MPVPHDIPAEAELWDAYAESAFEDDAVQHAQVVDPVEVQSGVLDHGGVAEPLQRQGQRQCEDQQAAGAGCPPDGMAR